MENTPTTQKARILAHLQAGHTITHLQCIDLFRCTSLAQRIMNLKRDGYPIESRVVPNSGGAGWHAEYYLEKESTTSESEHKNGFKAF